MICPECLAYDEKVIRMKSDESMESNDIVMMCPRCYHEEHCELDDIEELDEYEEGWFIERDVE